MDFIRKGPDAAEVACGDGTRVLFSYGRPVAMWRILRLTWGTEQGFVRVEGYTSRTTERHIREFVRGAVCAGVSPDRMTILVRNAC